MTAALTREQKLMAELVVQLGNIAEAIQSIASGPNNSVLSEKIESLEANLTTAAATRAALQAQLSELQQHNTSLQAQLLSVQDVDNSPDNLNSVMNHLGIDYT